MSPLLHLWPIISLYFAFMWCFDLQPECKRYLLHRAKRCRSWRTVSMSQYWCRTGTPLATSVLFFITFSSQSTHKSIKHWWSQCGIKESKPIRLGVYDFPNSSPFQRYSASPCNGWDMPRYHGLVWLGFCYAGESMSLVYKKNQRLMSAVVHSCSKYGQLRNNSYSSLFQNVAEEAGNTLFLHVWDW